MERSRWHIALMLMPALLLVGVLFGGGLGLAFWQSLGYLPSIGRTDLSFSAYREIFQQTAFLQSVLLTLWIACASTLLSSFLAVISALALRPTLQRQRWLVSIFQLNLPIPHFVGAIGVLLLFSQSGWLARLAYHGGLIRDSAEFPIFVNDRYAIGIILEYLWKTTCFTGINLLAVLQNIGDGYEEAARNLGATRWQSFRYIVLPLIMPTLFSSALLVFAFTLGSYEVPFLLGQRFPSALPVLAYRAYVDVDLNNRPQAMAMSMIIAALGVMIIILYRLFTRRL